MELHASPGLGISNICDGDDTILLVASSDGLSTDEGRNRSSGRKAQHGHVVERFLVLLIFATHVHVTMYEVL